MVSPAFDPTKRSKILYAGTSPLMPWEDAGRGRHLGTPSHTGMIDDSDVFPSIHVDWQPPAQGVFASACSGIYKAMMQGKKWDQTLSALRVQSVSNLPNHAGSDSGPT